ncbi:unnamed protein product [Linum trigynum]|uniref:Uncharacterized protein n=1 Tax=Linum trigynum TaxID=586398 RepID=A0AAV2ERB6_9ROSI
MLLMVQSSAFLISCSTIFLHMGTIATMGISGPFSPFITHILHCLGIDLEEKISTANALDTLRAQHVLRRVDARVGVRKKLLTAQGGDEYYRPNGAELFETGM